MTASQLIEQYGPPDAAYLSENCIIWEVQNDFPWFPAKEIYINKVFKDMLYDSFTAVQAAGLQNEITHFDGCYNKRDVRGSTDVSAHSYACAVDLNAAENPMVVKNVNDITPTDRLGKWSQGFVDAMTSSGVFFGGNFKTRPDPMHYSRADM